MVARAEFREVPAPAEAVVLAHRILQRESTEFLLDAGHRRVLAREIEAVLSRIRDADPSAAALTVRPSHALGRLILDLQPDLLLTLSDHLDDATGLVELRTGWADFDALNARLGLSAVTLLPALGTAVFHVDEKVNIEAAVTAYAAMDGVNHAEPDALLGDGPDIDASKTNGTWHVVVRRAWATARPAACTSSSPSSPSRTPMSSGSNRRGPWSWSSSRRFSINEGGDEFVTYRKPEWYCC